MVVLSERCDVDWGCCGGGGGGWVVGMGGVRGDGGRGIPAAGRRWRGGVVQEDRVVGFGGVVDLGVAAAGAECRRVGSRLGRLRADSLRCAWNERRILELTDCLAIEYFLMVRW